MIPKTNLIPHDYSSYNASSIKILDGLTGVRKRPEMYIGNTNESGLHQMIFEIIDNAIDESLAGFCNKISVFLHKNNNICITDNGRGIPIDSYISGKPTCEVILCTLHAGGKFDNNAYEISGGLHGIGISAVNALSEYLKLDIKKNNIHFRQWFSHGYPISKLIKINSNINESGTSICFWPDRKIFHNIIFNVNIISRHLKEQAFLNKNININLIDNKNNEKYNFLFSNGILSFIEEININHVKIHTSTIYINVEDYYTCKIKKDKKKCIIEIALQWNNSYQERITCFTNNIKNILGGTHLVGFKNALTRAINNYISSFFTKQNLKLLIIGEDIREGLTAIISIKWPNPKFNSQIKEKLVSPEVKGLIDKNVYEKITDWLNKNPVESKKICYKIINAAKTREATRKTKQISRKKTLLENTILPGRLSDCQEKNPEFSEIFIVEGESAGGSAKNGRNRQMQAILPLRGKILNVEKCRIDKMLSNQEIISIIKALGTGIGIDEFNINKIRYHKIIIMTDADVDGSHIRALLLTFFFRQMQEIIKKGYLFIAQSPLYKVSIFKKDYYFKEENNLKLFLLKTTAENMTFKILNYNIKKPDLILNILAINKYKNIINIIKNQYGIHKGLIIDTLIRSESIENINNVYTINKNVFINYIKKNTNIKIIKIAILEKTELEILILMKSKEKKLNIIIKYNDWYLLNIEKLNSLFQKFKLIENKHIQLITNTNKCLKFKNFNNLILYLNTHLELNYNIQRYKGLGEMNPGQLWDTTMNPANRMLLKISINDSIETDNMFTKLMGEAVEGRKIFLKNSILNKINLNI